MTGQGIHIRRWSNEYIVSREHVAAEEARIGLDTVARDLCSELTEGLEPWMSSQDDRVLLLNRLDFDCELDLTRERWTLARRWASAFARALIRASDVEVSGVARFSSQAEYRAQFVSDLVAGHAWHLWYYQPFDGIRHLPVATAVRTLLVEEPALGRTTILAMRPAAWNRLVGCLTPIEAARIVDGLCDAGGEDPAIDVVLDAAARHAAAAEPWFALALRIFADAIRTGAAATAALAAFSRLVARAIALAANHDVTAVTRAIADGDLKAWAALEANSDLATWLALGKHPEWRRPVCDAIQRSAPQRPDAKPPVSDEARTTFGGLLLLLSEIDALLSDAVTDALPATTIGNRRNVAAWIALAHAVGNARATAFVREAFWRDLLAIPADISLDTVRVWLEDTLAGPALACLADEARGLMRGADVVTSLTTGGTRRRVVVDSASLLWICFDEGGPIAAAPWRARLQAARAARADWTYVSPPWSVPPDWDRFFNQVAQIALRRLAYRIPGFVASSLVYVHANFLAVPARWNKRAGYLRLSRPPLHTVLQLTGVARGSVRWPGPPGVELGLEFEP